MHLDARYSAICRFVTIILVILPVLAGRVSAEGVRHGLAIYGEPALPTNFKHLPYADPAAPQGGRLTQAQDGSFDSLNPFILKGNAPAAMVPYVVQPLMYRSADEPFTVYGLLAETVETPPDRSWVEFTLNAKARFSDGTPVRAEDVAFSWALLRDRGRPAQRSAYGQVNSAEMKGERGIRFNLTGGNYELPLILALMPIFAKHATDPETFEQTSFSMPLGSGPYLLGAVNPGSSLTLRRNPAFWGKDLPVLQGLYNFDELKFDFYRDPNALFEAFKSGLYDIRIETSPVRWLTAYEIGAVRDGAIVRETARFSSPKPLTGFVFNTRRPIFADVRVREALSTMFDFEWLNANLFSGVYTRTGSYFPDSDLSSSGRTPDVREAALLLPFKTELSPPILEGKYRPPVSDGSGRDRSLVHAASARMQEAGYSIRNGTMRSNGGVPLAFEILVTTREKQQVAAAYADSLLLIGVKATVRLVDSSQYWARLRAFDYDMIVETYVNSASPGNEQLNRWSSAAAAREGSLNYPGVKSKAVDATLAALIAARQPEDYQAAVRALDRALLSGFYIVPLYFAPERWIAHSKSVSHPKSWARFDLTPDTWWTERR